ncbi:hypothetical protein M378DRAFT_156765, partial [Amanita muscaria Koide BX008]
MRPISLYEGHNTVTLTACMPKKSTIPTANSSQETSTAQAGIRCLIKKFDIDPRQSEVTRLRFGITIQRT